MTRGNFSRFDAADYLKDEQDIVAYLEAAIEATVDDPSILAVALGTVARAQSMSKIARDAGMTREGLYKALSSEGNPSFGTVLKVIRALGLKLTIEGDHHRPKEIDKALA